MIGFSALRIPALTVLALSLAGCAGGSPVNGGGPGDTGSGDTTRPVNAQKYAELNNEYLGLRNHYQRFNPETNTDMPVSGSATFNGVAGFSPRERTDVSPYDDSNAEVVADIAMTVYFAAQQINGSMWDFHTADGTQAGGSIQLTGTTGSPRASGESAVYADASFSAQGQGTLDWGDHQQDLDLYLSGFILDDRAGIKTWVSGSSTIDGEEGIVHGTAWLENDKVAKPALK